MSNHRTNVEAWVARRKASGSKRLRINYYAAEELCFTTERYRTFHITDKCYLGFIHGTPWRWRKAVAIHIRMSRMHNQLQTLSILHDPEQAWKEVHK